MTLSYEDVREILRIVEQPTTKELHLEVNDFKLILRKRNLESSTAATGFVRPATDAPAPAADQFTPAPDLPRSDLPSPTKAEVSAPPSPTSVAVKAPTMGTFYRAPAPDEAPFVEEGDTVTPKDTVCIIDVMKVMTNLKAPCSGRVVKICTENGGSVVLDQPLIWVEPDDGVSENA